MNSLFSIHVSRALSKGNELIKRAQNYAFSHIKTAVAVVILSCIIFSLIIYLPVCRSHTEKLCKIMLNKLETDTCHCDEANEQDNITAHAIRVIYAGQILVNEDHAYTSKILFKEYKNREYIFVSNSEYFELAIYDYQKGQIDLIWLKDLFDKHPEFSGFGFYAHYFEIVDEYIVIACRLGIVKFQYLPINKKIKPEVTKFNGTDNIAFSYIIRDLLYNEITKEFYVVDSGLLAFHVFDNNLKWIREQGIYKKTENSPIGDLEIRSSEIHNNRIYIGTDANQVIRMHTANFTIESEWFIKDACPGGEDVKILDIKVHGNYLFVVCHNQNYIKLYDLETGRFTYRTINLGHVAEHLPRGMHIDAKSGRLFVSSRHISIYDLCCTFLTNNNLLN